MQQAKAHGDAKPDIIQTHGTSTKLNNIAEIMSIYQAFRSMDMDHHMSINAIKGLIGHSMGAASAVDLGMGVQTLLEKVAPGLFNFRFENIDLRYEKQIPDALRQFNFSPKPVRGKIDNILFTSEGFLSSDGAAILGHFPQEIEAAGDMLKDYGFPEHERADWKAKAPANRARGEELEGDLRKGKITHLELVDQLRFRP
jgi:3-oxoacyl-(acyl-carrier-protein) synthase